MLPKSRSLSMDLKKHGITGKRRRVSFITLSRYFNRGKYEASTSRSPMTSMISSKTSACKQECMFLIKNIKINAIKIDENFNALKEVIPGCEDA